LLPKGDGNIEMVSEALNMNRRNLQRKLSGESTNFKQLLNELREELAEQYLRDQNLSMMDIAMLLGFSDNSAFTTAFKGWKTISPSEHRRITEQAK
jgi:AraC-like DNA-binding protein